MMQTNLPEALFSFRYSNNSGATRNAEDTMEIASGGPGDHPLSDITTFGLGGYVEHTDDVIRQIASLCNRRELYEWWKKEIGWQATPAVVVSSSAAHYAQLLERARLSGWEIPSEEGG